MSDIIGVIYCDYKENTINILKVDIEKLMNSFNSDLKAYVAAYVGANTYEWMVITKDTKIGGNTDILKNLLNK